MFTRTYVHTYIHSRIHTEYIKYLHSFIHAYIVCGSATGKDEVYWCGGRHRPASGYRTRFVGEEKHAIHS